MHNKIQHKGIVDAVSNGMVVVRVTQLSACSSCQMLERCHSTDSRDKLIDVPVGDGVNYRVGDIVLVGADACVGRFAVLLAFGVPLVLFMGVIVLVREATHDDVAAALCGLVALFPYYVALRLFRGVVRRKVVFRLKKVAGAEDNTK